MTVLQNRPYTGSIVINLCVPVLTITRDRLPDHELSDVKDSPVGNAGEAFVIGIEIPMTTV
ncbi:uncharacterized protein METZ01_LOCUS217528 [marine metagenome]|uniref:Uncharacterized protein n=1 Tax=marine metagenome TaxID=408172 RepID=A0A382FQN5_9ZZZZ